MHSHLIPEEIINHPDRLRKKINQLTEENTPITIQYYWGKDHKHIIFFGQSRLLKTLYWFPYIQLSVIAIFILLVSSLSAHRNTTSRTAYGSDWPKKRRTNCAPPPPRCWDGSNTCARSPSIRVPSKR